MPTLSKKGAFTQSLTRVVTGQIAFEGGVDGGRVALLATEANPSGLRFNQLSWLVNGSVRGGGITPRAGWFNVASDFPSDASLFQGGYVYEPDYDYPYVIFVAGGRTYRVRVDTDNSIEELTVPGEELSATAPKVWFCQAENYLIIQDGINRPLVWDGSFLRKIINMPGADPDPDKMLPAGEAMDYYMGRVWIAQGREYMAGDIVGSSASGTLGPTYRDAILHSTENLWLTGGGKFTVPTVAGDIRALAHTANLDTALGEGQLFVFTRNTIYSVNVPATRSDWAQTAQPLQRVAQMRYGAVSERSIVKVNGDLFYQAYDGVRSLMLAIRYFNQWGQTSLSHNVNRILQFNDRALIRYASGIEFDNRLLQTSLPIQTPVGVAHQALIALDFDLMTSLNEKLPPIWEGHLEGLDFLQLLEGDWGGLQRAFSFAVSRVTGRIQLWELSQGNKADNEDDRVTMVVEFPAYHFDDPMQLKQLDNGELWIDRMFGTVDFTLYYRQDQNPCWIRWYGWQECATRTTCEDVTDPICYPESRAYCEQDRITIVLPKAPGEVCDTGNRRPTDYGYSFQVKIEIKGFCRVRGLRLWAWLKDREPYQNVRNTT